MNRERAEAHLRLLAEAERRRVTALPADSAPSQWHSPGLALAAQALCAVGAVGAGVAGQIQAGLALAVAGRLRSLLDATGPGPDGLSPVVRERLELLMQDQLARAAAEASPVSRSSAGHTASRRASWRVVPVGQVIQFRNDGVPGELLLLAYVQTPRGAWFTAAGPGLAGRPGMSGSEPGPGPRPQRLLPFRQFTAADDHGASYRFRLSVGFGVGVVELRPDPAHEIRWLDLTMTPDEPPARIDLDPQDPPGPPPEVTVTRAAHSPGELLLDVIAARILTSAAGFPPDNPGQLAAAQAELRAFVGGGPGAIVAALHAAGALLPDSPSPGQLAGLCARLGISGHGITAPPAGDLPEPWQSMLTRHHPSPAPVPGSWAAPVAELPELDGARLAILGVHHGEPGGTIVHMLATGVAQEDDWAYSRVVRPLPVLWIRDSSGRWHTTRTNGVEPSRDTGVVMLWLEIVPALDRGIAWIDVVAAGRSAEIRARLPLRWK